MTMQELHDARLTLGFAETKRKLRDRDPISTYEQAVWRLIAEFERTGEYDSGGPLPFAAQMVADIYWCTETTLRRDLARFRGTL